MTSPKKIFYVDDEQGNLDTFEHAFGADYEVRTFLSAEEALKIALAEEVPLLIADQRMPGMSGIELCEKLFEKKPDTIRVILTAYKEPALLLDAIHRGHVHDYIVKPWKKSELKPLIDKYLEAYATEQETKLANEWKIKNLEEQIRRIHEVYTHGTAPEMLNVMSGRRASEWLKYVIPYIKPGFRVIDCGCGPGSLTVDLAEIVGPGGSAVGVDINTEQFEGGRRLAAERKITNVEFQKGNLTEIPFPDASFDAAIANTAIQHLRDPLDGLKEMRRILKPGGVIGIRDEDWKTLLWEPSTPLMEKFVDLLVKVWDFNGGQPFYPRRLRSLLLKAGFDRAEASASVRYFGKEISTQWIADNFLAGHFKEPNFINTAIEQGWVDRDTLKVMQKEVEEWAKKPDAFWSLVFCEAVGWVPS